MEKTLLITKTKTDKRSEVQKSKKTDKKLTKIVFYDVDKFQNLIFFVCLGLNVKSNPLKKTDQSHENEQKFIILKFQKSSKNQCSTS